jgi:hypothetical protein
MLSILIPAAASFSLSLFLSVSCEILLRHLRIYKNRTTDCPDQYESVDRFIYQMNNNGYKTTNFY